MKIPYKKIGLGLGFAAVIFILLNAQYFWAQLQYYAGVDKAPVAVEPSEVAPQGEPNRLSIPSLAIEAPIVYIVENKESVFQEALRGGVVHYPGTAKVGEYGNCYIFGHSSDYIWSAGAYKTIFATLPHIQVGALIVASNSQGQVFTYKVFDTRVVASDDTSVLDQGNRERQLLTLQTSYPVGTALRRFVAVAELVPSQ
ncbi:MAG TPA: sortase [Patescibacteria group bacterium]|nr:sortase [Patescibacteria group bacterium]